MQDELTPSCPPEKRIELGQYLYKWVEKDSNFPLRSVRERFLTTGSYHILSNRGVIGWHPDFKVVCDDGLLERESNNNAAMVEPRR